MVALATDCDARAKTGDHCRQSELTSKTTARRVQDNNSNNEKATLAESDLTAIQEKQPESTKRNRKKRNRNFINAGELHCFSFPPRQHQEFEKEISFEEEDAFFHDAELDREDLYERIYATHDKRKNMAAPSKARKQLKGIHYSTHPRFNYKGKKLFVKTRVKNRRLENEENLQNAAAATKANVERSLAKRNLTRAGNPHPQRSSASSNQQRQQKPCKFELTTNNVPPQQAEYLTRFVSLQHRDLTPEDYDLLLMLDEQVAPKAVEQKTLDSFKTDEVTSQTEGENCAICMDQYELGQVRKFLPCGHVFHGPCIDMWLSNSSLQCPLDGSDVTA